MKTMFVGDDNELVPYFDIVQFYFTITTVIRQQPRSHHLAYVTWLKFRTHSPEPACKTISCDKPSIPWRQNTEPKEVFMPLCTVCPKTYYLVSELTK